MSWNSYNTVLEWTLYVERFNNNNKERFLLQTSTIDLSNKGCTYSKEYCNSISRFVDVLLGVGSKVLGNSLSLVH